MKNINLVIQKWQQKLNLISWKVDFKLVDKFQRKDNYPQTGDIKINTKNKQAKIIILKTIKNPEKIIIHELVHLLLWDWDHSIEKITQDESAQQKHLGILENTVNNLTKILFKG